jgi:hypothetical protein
MNEKQERALEAYVEARIAAYESLQNEAAVASADAAKAAFLESLFPVTDPNAPFRSPPDQRGEGQ